MSGLHWSAPKNQVTSCLPPRQQLLAYCNSGKFSKLGAPQWAANPLSTRHPLGGTTSPLQDLGGLETNTKVLALLPRAVMRVPGHLSVSGVSRLLQHPWSCQRADLLTCTFGKTLDVPKTYCLEKKLSRDHNPICQKVRFQCRRLLILK